MGLDTIGRVSSVEPAVVQECRRTAATWAPTLRALANEDRLLIVLWLADGPRSVRELEQATGMSQPLVSYHLGELRSAGLVTATAVGRSNRYRLSNPSLDELGSLISRLCEPAARALDRRAAP